MIWGEIHDLRELDIACELTPAQAERMAVGESAEVRLEGHESASAVGKVVFVGNSADRTSGLLPLLIQVPNTDERLRAEIDVRVRFPSVKAQ